ncbi:MAG: hypothetical protein OEV55_09935 [candidate division Zixibacteria bacterium]|nr:hypothetical protein [candidate division Zixibacteria bacterium]
MKGLAYFLIVLAAIAFILAIIFRLANIMPLGASSQSAFRFAVLCLLFSLNFILLEIKNKKPQA